MAERQLLGNIKGPKGDTGPQGPKGDTGAQGPRGRHRPTGPAGRTGCDRLLRRTGPGRHPGQHLVHRNRNHRYQHHGHRVLRQRREQCNRWRHVHEQQHQQRVQMHIGRRCVGGKMGLCGHPEGPQGRHRPSGCQGRYRRAGCKGRYRRAGAAGAYRTGRCKRENAQLRTGRRGQPVRDLFVKE